MPDDDVVNGNTDADDDGNGDDDITHSVRNDAYPVSFLQKRVQYTCTTCTEVL